MVKNKTRQSAFTLGLNLLVVLALLLGGLPLAYAQPGTPPPPPAPAGAPESTTAGDTVDLPPGVSADWWTAVQEDIRQSEYHVTWQDHTYLLDTEAAYQAPNRAHNLRIYFNPQGPVVIPRVWPDDADPPPWRWGLRLAAWGREGALQPGDAATLQTETNRVEYRRGTLVEWYVNDERGLEQGFTLAAAPRSEITDPQSPLVLELALTGDLTPRLSDDGGAIEFFTFGGVRVLRYSDLYAVDAAGRQLPASLSLSSTAISISVDDTAAVYPITIDPLATTPNWSVSGLGAFHWATAGDVNGDGYDDVILGSPYSGGNGTVFVYYGSACGLGSSWAWSVSAPEHASEFGRAVGSAGDVNGDGYDDVIVGSQYNNGHENEGAVFVYYGSASGLSASPDWSAEGNQVNGDLGYSVGTAGDVNGDGWDDIIVGAPPYDMYQEDEGVVFVWYGYYSGLGSLGDWAAWGGQVGARLGTSVGTAGDVNSDGKDDIIAGAPHYGTHEKGATFVWHGSGSGLGLSADWIIEHSQSYAYFGESVGTAGDVNGDGKDDVIVGAPGGTPPAPDPAVPGRVFVYHGSSGGLSTTADWTTGSELDLTHFGECVGTAGDVDGDGWDDVIVGGEGGPLVFRGSADGLSELAVWSVEDGGWEVATAGDVNGDGYDDVIVTVSGEIQVYHGGPHFSPSPDWTKESDQANALFGYRVNTAGDVNGDGYSDVVVGASRYDHGQDDEGVVFVYHGSASGLHLVPDWFAEGDQESAGLARAGTAGDVNGDGYSDIIVGATSYDTSYPGSDEGAVFVWYGSGAGLGDDGTPANADWTAEGTRSDVHFGSSVGTAGDVNGDGYSDAVFGEPGPDGGFFPYNGRVFLYYGSGSGLSATADWTAESYQSGDFFGSVVGTAGDVNGDGYSDVIVGAPYHDNLDDLNGGRVFVYHGSADGPSSSADWDALNTDDEAKLGRSVGMAGDVNGDGYSDIIVGAHDSGDEYYASVAYVWLGSASGLGDQGTTTNADWRADLPGGSSGSVDTAGDVNGDGYADVIVGLASYDYGYLDEGAAFVYHGSGTGLSATPDWTTVGGQEEARLGSVGTAGDVNGDGYSDVIVGAPYYDHGQLNEGRAYVWYGAAHGLSTSAGWSAASGQADASFGRSVGTAGDVNGDGYADVIVGAYKYDAGQTDEGRVFVYHGSASGASTSAAWTAQSNLSGAYFGYSAGTVGDINGDGYDDVIVGAYEYDYAKKNGGAAFVWYGSSSGLGYSGTPTNADRVFEGDQDGARFGYSVGTAGDVNGDGYSDMIVGAYGYDNGETDEGAAFVWYGPLGGMGTGHPGNADWSAESDQADAYLGFSVGTAGDVNGDGHSDVIVGAPGWNNTYTDEGGAWVYHGSDTGLATASSWHKTSGNSGAWFGYSVGTAGDVDGNGYADVIVGAPFWASGQTNEGGAFVYPGSSSGLSLVPAWHDASDQSGATFGWSVGTAGDVNGDGYADVVVGARGWTCTEAGEGSAWVYHGSAAGLHSTPDWHAVGGQAAAYLGTSVSSAGDVNGDGYADVIVGAEMYDSSETNEGQARIYYGNGGAGLSINPRQRRPDDSVPIAHLGKLEGETFLLALLGRTPYGRGLVKLEWEVKPLGTPFDGEGTQMSAVWLDTGVAGVELDELVSNLSADTAYHWRVRLRYHPARIPHQVHSRWLTIPWNGWQEQDLWTGPADVIRVTFSSAAYEVNEGAGTATITVNLDAAAEDTITVDYATSDGTATAGADYSAASGTLTFDPGVTSQTFTVPILNDGLDEPDETIALALSDPTNATVGDPGAATLTITDDDGEPTVRFSAATYSVNEDSGVATIIVNLSNDYPAAVEVDYATSDGTGAAGSDYTAASGRLTFAPGVISQTFTVPILNDELEEDNETVILTLSDPTNATVGGTNPATLTITDDDGEYRIYLPFVVRNDGYLATAVTTCIPEGEK